MMKNKIAVLGFISLVNLVGTPMSFAAKTIKSCEDKLANDIVYSQCLDTVKNAVDKELQTWVNNQVFILEEMALVTGRTSPLSMFKRSQSNFITFRENNCRWQYLAKSPSKDSGPAYKRCYISVSKTRINELSKIN